jgi:NAD(P)-dependent dehydrogenase (short-subunit alcohol dehydrogenase family)
VKDSLFSVEGKCVAVTGGAGVLGESMCKALASRGAKLAVMDLNAARAGELCKQIRTDGGSATAIEVNVLSKESVEAARGMAAEALGRIDVLINAAGGNKKEATCAPPTTFFDLPADALRWVFELNCIGTMLPCQVFGKAMAEAGEGVIINISSMSAFHPLTRVVGYSAAKAAVSNFTEWLAVYMALNHSKSIRVNAIAPGFFLTEQNRFLLTDEKTGDLTARGRQIIDKTPMGRFGAPDELIGTLVWLISDASKFVTGVVVPVDGGFNVYTI